MKAPMVIIGTGLAGVTAAETLREAGWEHDIVMFGNEARPPYDRQKLSNALMTGEAREADLRLHDPMFYRNKGIELHTNDAVTAVDLDRSTISTRSGRTLQFGSLLVATGTSPRELQMPGMDLPNVHQVHSDWGCTLLATALRTRPRVVVVGAGPLGCEVAASARALGAQVTIVDTVLPMEYDLGRDVSSILASHHRTHGVDIVIGEVVAINGKNDVRSVSLADGKRLPCRLVVIAKGEVPNDGIVPPSLRNNGVLTNEFCQTASPNVFAAGSVANSWRPRAERHVRDGHRFVSLGQGRTAALSMMNRREPFDPVRKFVTRQFDRTIRFFGDGAEYDDVAVYHDDNSGEIHASYFKEGRVVAICRIDDGSRDPTLAETCLFE